MKQEMFKLNPIIKSNIFNAQSKTIFNIESYVALDKSYSIGDLLRRR